MKKISTAQAKLLNRIKEVYAEKAAGAASRNEEFEGWICSGYIPSKEFGWNRINIRTAIALAEAGYIHLRILRDTVQYSKRYNFGRDVSYETDIERSYEFKLVEDGEKSSIERWFSFGLTCQSGTMIRTEQRGRNRYTVYSL